MAILSGSLPIDRGLPVPAPVALVPIRRDDGWCDDAGTHATIGRSTCPAGRRNERPVRDDGLMIWCSSSTGHPAARLGRGSAIFFHCARARRWSQRRLRRLRIADMRCLLLRLG